MKTSKVLPPVRVVMAERFGDLLAGRAKGAEARQAIEREALALGPTDPVVLDFHGVEAVSVPFAEECIGALLYGHAGGHWDEHPIVAVNANEDVAETIAAALRQRRLSLLAVDSKGPMLLGGDHVLESTLAAANQLGTFRAGQLAELLDITPQAANNRLNALVRNRVLARSRVIPTGGGKEFAYVFPPIGASGVSNVGTGSQGASEAGRQAKRSGAGKKAAARNGHGRRSPVSS